MEEKVEYCTEHKDHLKDYLGDGVYAIEDDYGIWLYANDHLHPTDRIFLEPLVLGALIKFSERCKEKHC